MTMSLGLAAHRKQTKMASARIPEEMEGFVVGLIGMGDMGKMYALRLSAAGWR